MKSESSGGNVMEGVNGEESIYIEPVLFERERKFKLNFLYFRNNKRE